MNFVETITEFRVPGSGDVLVTMRSTLIETDQAVRRDSRGLASVVVGAVKAPFVDRPLTVTDFVRYQGASGDMNPIHHDARIRKEGWVPRSVRCWNAASRSPRVFCNRSGWEPENIRRFRVQFREQAWPGDVITYSGTVTDVREQGRVRFVDLALAATRQTGGTHVKAWATFEV